MSLISKQHYFEQDGELLLHLVTLTEPFSTHDIHEQMTILQIAKDKFAKLFFALTTKDLMAVIGVDDETLNDATPVFYYSLTPKGKAAAATLMARKTEMGRFMFR